MTVEYQFQYYHTSIDTFTYGFYLDVYNNYYCYQHFYFNFQIGWVPAASSDEPNILVEYMPFTDECAPAVWDPDSALDLVSDTPFLTSNDPLSSILDEEDSPYPCGYTVELAYLIGGENELVRFYIGTNGGILKAVSISMYFLTLLSFL
mmetsp:Transcript_3403/g.3364  ORF Transcript_3403/g.3364 Transcript_3403/m.3364 type:complete len:149 (+) Transcript_3403:94-540(+)